MPTAKKTSVKTQKVKAVKKEVPQGQPPVTSPAPTPATPPAPAPQEKQHVASYKVVGNVMHDGVSLHVGDVVTDPELIHALLPQGLLLKL